MLDLQSACRASARALVTEKARELTRIPMIMITASISIRVNPAGDTQPDLLWHVTCNLRNMHPRFCPGNRRAKVTDNGVFGYIGVILL